MTFQPEHFGLYFRRDVVADIAQNQEKSPYAAALSRLKSPPIPETFPIAMWHALRYRLLQDDDSGKKGVNSLLELSFVTGRSPAIRDGDSPVQLLRQTVAKAHLFEMLRDHPSFAEDARSQWLAHFSDDIHHLSGLPASDLVVQVWQLALQIIGAVVQEDESTFKQSVEQFRVMLAAEIHPDGYIHRAVKDDSADNGVVTYLRQVQTTAALCLAAEAATQAGTDLWKSESRGVDAITPLAYLHFFYFYPEKWQWGEGLTREDTARIMRREGAFIEMAASRGIIRDIELLLDDQRPLVDVYSGGITTLTHPAIQQRKRFRLFGRKK